MKTGLVLKLMYGLRLLNQGCFISYAITDVSTGISDGSVLALVYFICWAEAGAYYEA